MAYCKHVIVNTDNIKLVLGISAKIESNYFSLINVPDHPTPATTTHCLCATPAPPTTTATTSPPPPLPTTASHLSLVLSGSLPIKWQPVLEEQEKEKKKKKKKKWEKKKKRKKKEENDDDDEDDNNNDKLAI
ncbi:uncharacterized protein CIMG_12632 [Coccidioides immitis RS]|uniref:Uncharacterized protein n=1 Tax=Coccidioides immitis (strain RS) TaxID=246410 RepID=J3KM22_COCIM|nr:uncharacterized protein CIMG_12632 [Coccidioides immitis RS]EAS37411.3 hypothetical protein CIMG_12632 [Coccidioides immitis RS]